MTKISVRPAPGLKVRTEDGRRHIAEAGESVAHTTYIARRLRVGDLVRCVRQEVSQPDPAASEEIEPNALEDSGKPRVRKASKKEL